VVLAQSSYRSEIGDPDAIGEMILDVPGHPRESGPAEPAVVPRTVIKIRPHPQQVNADERGHGVDRKRTARVVGSEFVA
jgi:hypothetical protein